MYLELLAADDTNRTITKPRWMGVDLLSKNRLTRWALRSDSLLKDRMILKNHHPDMGDLSKGSRNTGEGSILEWELLMPLAEPEVELLPFCIDWGKSTHHPSQMLPAMNCSLKAFYGAHPQPEKFNGIFEALGFEFQIDQGEEIDLRATIQSPNGLITL